MGDDIWDAINKCIDSSLNNVQNSEKNEREVNEKKSKKSKFNYNVKFTIYLTRGQCYCILSDISGQVEKKLKNYFTIRSKNIMGYFDITKNYYYSPGKKKIFLPRFGIFLLNQKFPNLTILSDIRCNNIINSIQWNGLFKSNQKLIFDVILKKYYKKSIRNTGKSGLILNLEAGQGKTFVAMGLISHLKCRTLIIVHNSTILFQWVELLKKYFPNQTIGVYYGKKKIYGDIIVGIINSLSMDKIKFKDKDFATPSEFYKTVDFCIFDECHEYCSKSRSKIFRVCQSPHMLGLSATPEEREDNLHKIIKWNIGPILHAKDLNGYTEDDIKFTGEVQMVKYLGHPDFTRQIINEKLEMTSVPLMIGQITSDPYRIQIIVDNIHQIIKKNRNVFVFADRRSYLKKIQTILEQSKLSVHWMTSQKELAAYTLLGGCNPEDVTRAEQSANIILTTYQFMGTGKSIPKMNAIILATPRKSKSRQYINRIFRLGSDISIKRYIIDIVDWKTTLKTQWYRRKKYYKEKGYPIKVIPISYEDIDLGARAE